MEPAWIKHGALAAGILALSACASTPPPHAELASARASVAGAQSVGVRYAPDQLRLAQAKLARAEAAMARENYAEARRLAEQARADARLAESMAESARMQTAAAEVNESIRTLRQELQRRAQ
jgi:hypothetical protein